MDMDKLYGVGITNRYSCFIDNEDADPAEVKDAEKEKDPKKKGKGSNTGTTTAEKENRGKEITSSSSSTQPGKESTSTKVQKQKSTNDKTVTTTAPRIDRKGIRDSNTKGNTDIRGNNRAPAGGQQQKEQRSGEGDKRPPKPERPRLEGDRPPRDRPQGERFQGEKPQGGDRYHGGDRHQQTDRYQGERFQGGDRPARFNNDDGREVRNNRRNEDSNRESNDFDGRGPRRDGGYFRGGDRGGRGQNFRGSRGGVVGTGGPGGFRKREFDRQSGSDKSGVKAVDKRDGAGSRNWGTYKDDEVEVTAERTTDENTEERVEDVAPSADTTLETEEPGVDAEQQKLMTLDEWKALQEPRAKPVFNLRKAGEGEDQSQWKKMTLKKKEKESEAEEEEEEEYEECHQRAGRQKQILDVNFTFADSRRGGFGQRSRPGGRGGGGGRGERSERGGGNFYRGEGRGEGRGGGGFRGGFSRGGGGSRGGGYNREQHDRNPRQAAPKVDDDFDFPALG